MKQGILAFTVFFLLAGCGKVEDHTRQANQNLPLDMTESGKVTPLNFLALGDSYTIGERVAPEERWPVVLAEKLTAEGIAVNPPKIIATTGWTTDELKKGIEEARLKDNFDLVSLLIGVNNQYRDYNRAVYKKEFQELLDMAISFANNDPSRVFVVSIPDYGVTPFGQKKEPEKISREIDLYNGINKELADRSSVKYFNITGISRQAVNDPEMVAADGLHPSEKMYRQWVEHIFPGIRKMLK